MLVFAIAILIGEYINRRVWLISSLTQRKTYVTEILRHIFIQRLDFVFVGRTAVDQLLGLRFDLIVRNNSIAFEIRIPFSQIVPTIEGRHLHFWWFGILCLFPPLARSFFVVILLFSPLKHGVVPTIQSSPFTFLNCWLKSFLGFQLDQTFIGNVHFELFVKHDYIV